VGSKHKLIKINQLKIGINPKTYQVGPYYKENKFDLKNKTTKTKK